MPLAMVCMAVGQSNRSRCSMAQMRHPVFSPKAIFIIAWGNAPGIGLCCVWPLANPTGRDVRWPKCDTRFFSPKAILIIAWGNAPGRANHVIPYSSSQGRCPWLWCAWPLANRTVRDVRWRKCDTRFFSPKAIFRRNQSQTYCSSNLIP